MDPTSSLDHRFMDRSLAHPVDPSLPRPEGLNPKLSELSPVGNKCMLIQGLFTTSCGMKHPSHFQAMVRNTGKLSELIGLAAVRKSVGSLLSGPA